MNILVLVWALDVLVLHFSTLLYFQEDFLISVPSEFSSYPVPAFCFHPAHCWSYLLDINGPPQSATPFQTTCRLLLIPLSRFVPTPVPLACVARSVCGPKPLWLPVVLSIEVIIHNVCSYNCFDFKVSLRLFSRRPKFFPNDQRVLIKNSYWPSYRSVSPSRGCFEISFDYIRNIIL